MNRRELTVYSLLVLAVCGCVVGVIHAAVPQSTIRTDGAGVTTYVAHYLNGTLGWYQGTTEILSAGGNLHVTGNITVDGEFLNGYNITDIMGYPETENAYIIFTDGVNYYAKNGTTGHIEYSGTKAEVVINSAYNQTNNYKTIIIKDNITLNNPITPLDNTTIILNGKLNIRNAVTSNLTNNANLGQANIIVANGALFSTGDYIIIIDTARTVHYSGRYGDSGYILNIVGNTLTLDHNLLYTYTVANNAYVTTAPSAILIEGKQNVEIFGNGEVNGNRVGQSAAYPLTSTASEDTRLCVGVSIYNSQNINVHGLKIHDFQMHNIAIYNSSNIEIHESECYAPNDKNILAFGSGVDYSDYIKIYNNYVHDSVNEDGIIFYLNVRYSEIYDNTVLSNNRYGVCIQNTLSSESHNNYVALHSGGTATQRGYLFKDNTGFTSDSDISTLNTWGFRLESTGTYDQQLIAPNSDSDTNGIYFTGNSFSLIGGYCDNSRVILESASNVKINGLQIWNTNYGANGVLRLISSTYVDILSSTFGDNIGYGISLDAGSNNIQIRQNRFINNSLGSINNAGGANVYIDHNPGYITEKTGTLLNTTASTFTITHTLITTPTGIWASFNSTEILGWAWTANSTHITITISGTFTSNKIRCYWNAVYYP